MTEQQALQIAVEYLPQIKIVAARACRYCRSVLQSEIESYLVSRMYGILQNYVSTLSTLKTHVSRNLCWYAYKFVCNELHKHNNADSNYLNQRYYIEAFNLDRRDEVNNILDGLSEYHQSLLYMRFVEGLTQDQIAKELGISKSSARNHINDALQEAREIANIE